MKPKIMGEIISIKDRNVIISLQDPNLMVGGKMELKVNEYVMFGGFRASDDKKSVWSIGALIVNVDVTKDQVGFIVLRLDGDTSSIVEGAQIMFFVFF